MEKVLIIADSHLESGVEPEPAYQLVKKVVKTIKFDRIVHLGDWLDLTMISQWVDGKPGRVEGDRLSEELDLLRCEIKYFKKCCKSILLLEGNHDNRIEKILDKYPVFKGTFPGLSEMCREEKVDYVSLLKQPYKLLDDLFVTHGVSFSKYFFAQMIERAGVSMISGHAHRTGSYTFQYIDGRVTTGYGLGTLGPVNPEYCAGQRITGHSQSFGILYVEGSEWQLDIIYIKNRKCIIAGKAYSLEERC